MGDSFAWTIPLIQAGAGVLFLAARRAGAAAEAGWWGTAFLLTAGAFLVPLVGPMLPDAAVAVTADTLFAVGFYAFGSALLVRHHRPLLTRIRLGLLAASIAAPAVGVLAVRELWAELVASDVTCSLEIGLALVLVPLWPRGLVDRGIVGLSWLVVLDNLVRTASVPLTAAGATVSTFTGTEYSYLMQATAMVESVGLAGLALVAVVSDVVAGHRRDALVDPLTGLLNRRGLDALAGAGAGGLPSGQVDAQVEAVVSCDLDHFKRVNDSWGHEAGDRVLVAFAELVRRTLPAGALAARTGGEEFVLLLPGHSLAAAQAVASGLRGAMAAHDWSPTGIRGSQTASFGVAVRVGRDREALADALGRADARLYDAKRAGRDRIMGAQAA